MKISSIIERIERTAPLKGACSWDKSGVQVAGEKPRGQKIAVALDPLPAFVERALDWGADFLLTHHPLAMEPKFLNKPDAYHGIVRGLMKNDSWLYAAHTSLDAQPDGPAGWLMRGLNLQDVDLLEITHAPSSLGVRFSTGSKLAHAFTLPETWDSISGVIHVEAPALGEIFLVCARKDWDSVRAQLSQKLDAGTSFVLMDIAEPENTLGIGQVGNLTEPMAWPEFDSLLSSQLPRGHYVQSGPLPDVVKRVAICPGSGGSLLDAAQKSGADVYITGDMKYHQALEAEICVIDVGHFSLEEEMMRLFAQELDIDMASDGVEVQFFPGRDPQQLVVLHELEL